DEIGTYRVIFGVLPEGRYTAKIAGAKPDDASSLAVLDVRNLSEEQLDLRARPDLMQRIAADSGGTVLDKPDVARELAEQFQQRLSELKRRLLAIAAACGAGWALCALAGLLILAMWLDLMVELPPALRVSADGIAIVVAIVLCARLVIFALRDALPLELGRRI